MKFKAITFSRNIQVRPYETERSEVTIEPEEGDDPRQVAAVARAFVEEELGLRKPTEPKPSQDEPEFPF